MQELEVIKILQEELKFTDQSIDKLKMLEYELLKANKKHNFIANSTENHIWFRHILDSAQIVKYIDFRHGSLLDLGSGAGFPGLILALNSEGQDFHVKLAEKSLVKRRFLRDMADKLNIEVSIIGNIYNEEISADIIVCRAFKKLEVIMKISREILKKSHKIIILKGKDAQAEINNLPMDKNYSYKLETSITDKKSKIVIVEVIK